MYCLSMDGRIVVSLSAAALLSVSGYASLGLANGPDASIASSDYVSENTSRCLAVPGASAGDVAVVNITNTSAAGTGYGALRASDGSPVFSRSASAQFASVNFAADTPANPNLAFTKIGPDGNFCYDGALWDHNVILDAAAIIPAANINAIDPTRFLDTRTTSLLAANSSVCVAVPNAAPGDVAVVNITNTGAAGNGYGALRSSDATPVFNRSASNQYASVNFAANTPPNPNLGLTKIGPDGKFCYDGAVNSHHVIMDVAAVLPAANVNAIDPTRLVDTRTSAILAANSSTCHAVVGASPGDVAVINIANTGAAGSGYGALRASDATPVFARPAANQYASVNFAADAPPNPNLAFTKIGADGTFCYDGAVHDHHVILDVAAIIPGSNITAIDPIRLLDTRDELPPIPVCDPSYPTLCIAPPPPDLNCDDLTVTDFPVRLPDPHRFDPDRDGIGCESPPVTTTTTTTTTAPGTTTTTTDPRAGCHPSYPDVCIPPPPPDLNCGDLPFKNIRVIGVDPHRLDGDGDGIACVS